MTKKEKMKFQELLISLDTEIARARQEEDRAKAPYEMGGSRYRMDLLPADSEAWTGASRARQASEKAKEMVVAMFPEVYKEVMQGGI